MDTWEAMTSQELENSDAAPGAAEPYGSAADGQYEGGESDWPAGMSSSEAQQAYEDAMKDDAQRAMMEDAMRDYYQPDALDISDRIVKP